MTEFQSHETSFDPLNSTQIPEKINAIEWINKFKSSSAQLLTANDKLIKLWKIDYRKEKKYESCKKLLQKGKLAIPRSKVMSESWEGRYRHYYKNAHEYHINSLSLCADGENFLSTDDLRINIWNIEKNDTVYNVLDIKPKSLDDLEEVITHSEFHPYDENIFLYTTSKGFLNICDFREASSF
jgi:serine/threonine-protein phosphatase 2A regulatory subunit B